jgi:Cys-tRNA(Pro)/Cys-tRNA(Cys) deacylase
MGRRTSRRGGSTPATTALTRAKVAFTLHPYDHDPGADSFGLEAAAALGVAPGQVLKTLLAHDGRADLVVGIVPVDQRLDLKALAAAVGAKRLDMANPDVAERTTGYVVGGISPVGQRRRLPTVLDSSALSWETVYVSGGRRGLDIGLSPEDLVRVTAARTADIAR